MGKGKGKWEGTSCRVTVPATFNGGWESSVDVVAQADAQLVRRDVLDHRIAAADATDDLAGWFEKVQGESKRNPGVLDGFELSRQEIDDLIMSARVVAGWVSIDDIIKPAAEAEEVEPEEAVPDHRSDAEALFATPGSGQKS